MPFYSGAMPFSKRCALFLKENVKPYILVKISLKSDKNKDTYRFLSVVAQSNKFRDNG